MVTKFSQWGNTDRRHWQTDIATRCIPWAVNMSKIKLPRSTQVCLQDQDLAIVEKKDLTQPEVSHTQVDCESQAFKTFVITSSQEKLIYYLISAAKFARRCLANVWLIHVSKSKLFKVIWIRERLPEWTQVELLVLLTVYEECVQSIDWKVFSLSLKS